MAGNLAADSVHTARTAHRPLPGPVRLAPDCANATPCGAVLGGASPDEETARSGGPGEICEGNVVVQQPVDASADDAHPSLPPTGPNPPEQVIGATPGTLVFEEFVASRGPALVRLARGLLRDPYLAEDVVQDVLGRALLQWARVSAAQDVDAYVRRMVVNACTSWFRRAARRERATDSVLVLDMPSGDGAENRADRDQLIALLRKLPAKQRAVLVLRHYEGLPDSEIAVMMNCSEVTVRSNAHRGLAKLRDMLTESRAAGA